MFNRKVNAKAAIYPCLLMCVWLSLCGCSESNKKDHSGSETSIKPSVETDNNNDAELVDGQSLSAIDDTQLLNQILSGMPQLIDAVYANAIEPLPNPEVSPLQTLSLDQYQIHFIGRHADQAAGFEIRSGEQTNVVVSGWTLSHLHSAQTMVNAFVQQSNAGDRLVLISRSIAALQSDNSPLLFKPSAPSPDLAKAVNVTWVDLSDVTAPELLKSLTFDGHLSGISRQDGNLYILQSSYAWHSGLTNNPDDPQSELSALADMAEHWSRSPQPTESSSWCLSDLTQATTLHTLIAIDLAEHEAASSLCIHMQLEHIDFADGHAHLYQSGNQGLPYTVMLSPSLSQ